MGKIDLVKSLIANEADVNNRERGDGSFTTPLHRAVLSGYTDIVELLLAKGADINAKGGWRSETLGISPIESNSACFLASILSFFLAVLYIQVIFEGLLTVMLSTELSNESDR